MAPQPESATGSVPLFGSGATRDRSKLNNMSISKLVSVLRDSFLRSDFDRVEETLVAREAKLKAEIEEKNREIGLLQEKIHFERLGKISVELELKKIKQERGEGKENVNNGFGLDGKIVNAGLGCERSKLVGLNNKGDANAVAEVECEKVEFLVDKKRLVVGEPSKNDGLGASGGRLRMGTVIDIEDSDEDKCNSQATLNRKKTSSCIIADNEHPSSSGAIQKNLPTRLTEPNGILKRGLASSRELGTNINILDSDTSSSSSSSSGSLDMDSLPLNFLPSNKKMRIGAGSLGLNS